MYRVGNLYKWYGNRWDVKERTKMIVLHRYSAINCGVQTGALYWVLCVCVCNYVICIY